MIDHMTPPTDDGRHPDHQHLVMAEIEPHYGSYVLTISGHDGDALISEDDARQIFGDQFDDEFGYIVDDYLDVLS